MGWYVVKFEDEDTVEAVPKTWYSKDTKECNWPPSHWNSNKINDFIKFKKEHQNMTGIVIEFSFQVATVRCVSCIIYFIYITKYEYPFY